MFGNLTNEELREYANKQITQSIQIGVVILVISFGYTGDTSSLLGKLLKCVSPVLGIISLIGFCKARTAANINKRLKEKINIGPIIVGTIVNSPSIGWLFFVAVVAILNIAGLIYRHI